MEPRIYRSERDLIERCPEAREVVMRLARYRADWKAYRDLLEQSLPLAEHAADVPRKQLAAEDYLLRTRDALGIRD